MHGVDDPVAAWCDQHNVGAVLLVAYHDQVIHHRAFGWAQRVSPGATARVMTVDAIFDLASITKVAATTVGIMTLIDTGAIDLDGHLPAYLPGFERDGKHEITVRHLLTHRAGLPKWEPTYLHARGRDAVLAYLRGVDLPYAVGKERRYSDLGFILLGAIIEEASGQRLDTYLADRVYRPLGMTSTCFRPGRQLRSRVAATSIGNGYEYSMIESGDPYPVAGDPRSFAGWRSYALVGEANDGNAWYGLDGIAGHAGLFSTAADLATLGRMLASGGTSGSQAVVAKRTLASFLHDQYDAGQALGFWSDRLSVIGRSGGFGHRGFTGTEFLFDPDRGLVVVLLTNRLHADGAPKPIDAIWHAVLRSALAMLDPDDR